MAVGQPNTEWEVERDVIVFSEHTEINYKTFQKKQIRGAEIKETGLPEQKILNGFIL